MSGASKISKWLSATLIVVIALGSVEAHAQPQSGSGTLSPGALQLRAVPSGEAGDLLFRLMNRVINLFGQNPLSPRHEIDRVVDIPWTLNPDTLERVQTLPARIQFELFRWNAEMLAGTQTQDHHLLLDFPNGNFAAYGSAQSGLDLADRLFGVLTSYLTTEQFIDLGVYLASGLPGFPRTFDRWAGSRHWIVSHAGLLGLLTLAFQSVLNTGTFRVSGTIAATQNGRQRLSWTAVTRNFGIRGSPSFGGGLQYTSPSLEAFLMAVGRVNAPQGSEQFALETSFQHVFRWIASGQSPWEFAVRADARLPIQDTMQEREYRFQSVVSGTLRRERIGSPAIAVSGINLMLAERLGLDVTARASVTTAVAIEWPAWNSSLTLQHQMGFSVDGTSSAVDQRLGMYGGGPLESRERNAYFQLNLQCHQMRRLLERMNRIPLRRSPGPDMWRLFQIWGRYTTNLAEVRRYMARPTALVDYCISCEDQADWKLQSDCGG